MLRLRVSCEFLTDLPAIRAFQPNVKHQQIGLFEAHPILDFLGAAGESRRVITIKLKPFPQNAGKGKLIVDDEYSGGHDRTF